LSADLVVFNRFLKHIEGRGKGLQEGQIPERVQDEKPMGTEGSESETYPELISEPRKVGWIWWIYLFLYAVAIPWYWPAGYRGPLIAGFPLWVAVSLTAILVLAIWTTWVIQRFWRGVGEDA
jgi:hypothetical protein